MKLGGGRSIQPADRAYFGAVARGDKARTGATRVVLDANQCTEPAAMSQEQEASALELARPAKREQAQNEVERCAGKFAFGCAMRVG